MVPFNPSNRFLKYNPSVRGFTRQMDMVHPLLSKEQVNLLHRNITIVPPPWRIQVNKQLHLPKLCRIEFPTTPKKIPEIIESLDREIKESEEWILSLKDNWDGKGSKGYLRSTWMRSVNFLKALFENLIYEDILKIPIPEILPGPHGSIDLHWKLEKFELLINIPTDPDNAVASFYGDNYGDLKIRGTFNIDNLKIVPIHWLMPNDDL